MLTGARPSARSAIPCGGLTQKPGLPTERAPYGSGTLTGPRGMARVTPGGVKASWLLGAPGRPLAERAWVGMGVAVVCPISVAARAAESFMLVVKRAREREKRWRCRCREKAVMFGDDDVVVAGSCSFL